ncbi:MAG TPA: hypothetical protein VFQ06_05790, partial [Nitrospira sp.]|nr:hypothetical protein [Nitrospira sp.]
LGGGLPVRISGPTSECINGQQDQVWLTLYRVITSKKQGFLSRENEAAIIAKVVVNTKPQAPLPKAYPLSTKMNIRPYPTGQISLPVEYALINGLPLKEQDASGKPILYTGFSVETTLVNLKSRNGFGAALDALTQVTGSKKLPIPDSPFTQAAGYLLEFANNAVTNDLNSKNAADKLTTATLVLNFDPEGSCKDDPFADGFEKTGIKAIVMATGIPGSQLIPLDAVTSYCWAADTKPSFIVKAAKAQAGLPCGDKAYAPLYKPVTNDYVAFLLQKRRISTTLGPGDNAAKLDMTDSQGLCDWLGLDVCPAANP